jgi:bifunctional UDP-N-acetylglucosamine pyrophosphorylase/glucosamine-1-phosphate N-acetyltransferase
MLLGRPVWQRCLDAVLALKPRRIVWVGNDAPPAFDTVSVRQLASLRGPILLVPAEAPCLVTSALKRVSRAGARRAHALFRSDGSDPVVIATHARALKNLARGNAISFKDVARKLLPDPVFTDDDELLVVDSAHAWSDAHRILRLRKLAALMRRGVLVPDPLSVSIDPEVVVGAGALLSPYVLIEGASRIGKACTIGSFSHLVNASVGAETAVLDHCFIRNSRIGKRASIGPFAHLRPDSDVGDTARIGNFVELKNAKLGAGAKASHLSYVGDAKIGRNANLGAGTITCNYDGRVKNRTVVGDGAFIGSDVQLVAPVTIGKGAFVAAGSCIVNDVPAGALALARSHQIIKKNWVKRRRKS